MIQTLNAQSAHNSPQMADFQESGSPTRISWRELDGCGRYCAPNSAWNPKPNFSRTHVFKPNVRLVEMRYAMTVHKIVALALCVFTVLALADPRPDPPATRSGATTLRSAGQRAGLISDTSGENAWSCALPVERPPLQTVTWSYLSTVPSLTYSSSALTFSTPRAPPCG
jgi:hypothetical protein